MKVLSPQEMAAWCQAHDVALDRHNFPDRSGAVLKFEIPLDAQKRVFVVSQAMEDFREEPVFLVWFADWSV